jgi:hypothetical protein
VTFGGADALAVVAVSVGVSEFPKPFCIRGGQGNADTTQSGKRGGLESVPPEPVRRAGNPGRDCGNDLVSRPIRAAGIGGRDHHQPGPANISSVGTQFVGSGINCHSGGWWRHVGFLSGQKLGTPAAWPRGFKMIEFSICVGCFVVGFVMGMVHKQRVLNRLNK